MSELPTDELPRVTVLIAARNEESTILDCLRSVEGLDYPTHRLQVLIGNDGSTDRTGAVVRDFIQGKPQFSLLTITEQLPGQARPGQARPGQARPGLNGKANVLAQLAHAATGEYLFTTDADARVPPGWLRAMLAPFGQQTDGQPMGIVNGCTLVSGHSVGAKLQAVESVLVFRLLALAAQMGVALTGAGNNMAIRNEAYTAVGGFEGQPFSVVEDYTLFQSIVRQGYGFRQLMGPETLVWTLPPPSIGAYFRQRKRWMQGVFDLPFLLRLTTLGQYLLAPLLLILAFWFPALALGLYTAKVVTQTLLLGDGLIRLRQTRYWPYVLLYEPYQTIAGLLLLLYYSWPGQVEWKGRRY
ncbi:glycosyltransferase [Rudanella paleaurantiibacter]|uniref:Glycosyltransferase n=1 Tax=Rudanella paleaurantiibacter TaxID=2614655 RepID=A0A7J5TUG4_9BACT|nr:glycosyltransferase [Rudanella paleaurantiibacter]KAB7727607.1 glycosyltransferase [Rudanella paleaurantiibacter]